MQWHSSRLKPCNFSLSRAGGNFHFNTTKEATCTSGEDKLCLALSHREQQHTPNDKAFWMVGLGPACIQKSLRSEALEEEAIAVQRRDAFSCICKHGCARTGEASMTESMSVLPAPESRARTQDRFHRESHACSSLLSRFDPGPSLRQLNEIAGELNKNIGSAVCRRSPVAARDGYKYVAHVAQAMMLTG